MSIYSGYLNSIANNVMNDVDNVLINDSIVINSFTSEQVTSNAYELIFNVEQVQTSQITNIKVRKSDNSLISDTDVNIPIVQNEVVMRHLITISEVL